MKRPIMRQWQVGEAEDVSKQDNFMICTTVWGSATLQALHAKQSMSLGSA